MSWKPYDLDHLAQEVVLKARQRDAESKTESLNQAHKMRATCAYGLERFWGEHLRLGENVSDRSKAAFVADVWCAFIGIIKKTGIELPNKMLEHKDSESAIQSAAEQIWRLDLADQQACLAVLTSLCDSVVWWTQRLKTRKGGDG